MVRGRTKWFLPHKSRILGWSIDNRRCDEVACSLGVLATDSDLVFPFLDIVEEALHSLVLHGILDRPKEDVGLVAFAHLERLGGFDHRGFELVEDLLVHEDALEGDADLG